MKLPTELIDVVDRNPSKLFIFSNPKVGKTSLVAQLPNCLILDAERGTKFVKALKLPAENIDDLREISDAIDEKNEKLGKFAYDYIAIDTVTALQDIAKELALKLYKKTPMGSTYKGDDVLKLPNGGGYYYLREAFEKIYKSFEGRSKCLILLGHIKPASILKDGKELMAKDIDLTGKIKSITAADMDAIGYLYRKGNQNILSFKTSEDDLATGARPPHLRGQEIIISEYDPTTEVLTTHWDKIFLK
jgi:hypothetical protein